MLLTLKPPLQNGLPSPHAYSPPQPPAPKLFSDTLPKGNSLPPLPDTSPRRMSTPHRGLPPPLAMTLPNPNPAERGPPPPPSLGQSMGQLPAPPPREWQGADEPMRNWLAAKTEEDKRKQEEERTRQESLRLEQRKIEQTMLRESLQGGVPPYMVPMVFAGMGGGNLPNASLEWAQHYMAQISLQQQHQHQAQIQQPQPPPPPPQQPLPHTSPNLHRDRAIPGPQPNPYASQLPPSGSLPSQAQGPPGGLVGAPYQLSSLGGDRARPQQNIQAAPPPTSAPRMPSQSNLSRLNTGEMQIQPPPQGGVQLPVQHPIQQTQASQHQEQQSPSTIYFHHWVPPNSQRDQPPTPSGKSQHGSPYSQTAGSHLRSEYVNSPKKRKTNHSGPPGSSRTPETSPQFSHPSSAGRRRAHSNQRSDASSRGVHEALGRSGSRPQSRQRQRSTSDAESGSQRQGSTQPETAQSHDSAGPDRKRVRSGTTPPKKEAEGPS